jgi:hypothetical protein
MNMSLRNASARRGECAVSFGAFTLLMLLLLPAPASAQGLFDFLFGGRTSSRDERSIVAYAPDLDSQMREAPRLRQRAAPLRPAHQVKRIKLKPLPKLVFTEKPGREPPPPLGEGALAPFLNDPTLRAGDVVVTKQGLLVYRGSEGSRHRNSDFVSLGKARTLPQAERNFLTSIELANKVAPLQIASDDMPARDELGEQASNDPPRQMR